METAFMEEKRLPLRRAICKSAVILVIMLVSMMMASVSSWQKISHRDIVMIQSGTFFFNIVVWATAGLYFWCGCDSSVMDGRMLEKILLSMCCVCSVSVYLCDGWYCAKLVGRDPAVVHEVVFADTLPWFSDGRVMLGAIFILVCTHMALPLRWISLGPLVILHECLFAFAVLGRVSPEPSVAGVFNLILFTGILVLVSVGKHRMETYEREAAIQLISEKVARCRSEFRVAQLEKSKESSIPRAADVASTVPSTTKSSLIFEACDAWGPIAELALKEQWLIESKELMFESEEPLGEGGCGVVVRAVYHGADVAVKFPWSTEQTDRDKSHLLSLLNEMRILRHLRHPNIVGFVGACVDVESSHVGLVLELVNGVSLEAYIEEVGAVNDRVPERRQLIFTIQCGIEYLHSRSPPIVHGDLKDTNIFACVQGHQGGTSATAKILDFGLSRVLTRNAKPLRGTFRWMAPEVARGGHRPALSADVFSFGKVVFFVASSTLPDATRTEKEIVEALLQGKVLKQQWPGDCVMQDEFETVVDACLEGAPQLRPLIDNALQTLDRGDAYLDALESTNTAVRETATSDGSAQGRIWVSTSNSSVTGSLSNLPPLSRKNMLEL
eukprot:TRINITY_DN7973_c0_g2_i1.p1 TRINITY_DN7973_c0_g2~~TRINITY_DN7973_c0_g2_i1.p1  ORF type:complete len:658 (-),score=100.33 TRINITY_DN7973_c0_g2_i1:33-1868(-)